MSFLPDREPRDLNEPSLDGIRPERLFLGSGPMGLEVAQFTSARRPTASQLRDLHDHRRQRRATPVLIVVTHSHGRAAIATRFGDEWSLQTDLDQSQVERLCTLALDAPDRHAADAVLRTRLPQLDSTLPGVRNSGLFAMHELEEGVRLRPDWTSANAHGAVILALRGRELITQLGFTVEQTPWPASILRASGTRTAVAVFLERADEIEPANERYDGVSPVSYALAKADAENLEYVVVSAGSILRIYPAKPGVGTARRGRTETFVELDLALLDGESAGYLILIASGDALASDGTFGELLESSKRFAADLGVRLRERIYDEVMPALARALWEAQRLRNPTRELLQQTFEMSLMTLFRLLFVAYAEDKELLPYHTSEAYREHSLKRIAQRLAEESASGTDYGDGDFYWTEVLQLWKAVDGGNPAWRVPAYNGGLFSTGNDASPAAISLNRLKIPDSDFVPPLRALLLDTTTEEMVGPVDFRALGVREFGTIYEGLLEQELSVAEQDLVLDANDAYIPAVAARRQRGRRARAGTGARETAGPAGEEPLVREGEIYLHDKSGARKSSGAYYTKDFAVEHLLEGALEPALKDHLGRLDALYDARDAADRFFDFHVADIAMGSGHFLVAAVDHLERGLSGYLAKRALPGVRDELARLRKTAGEALGEEWRGDPIEDSQLLRRQIARRCIHGVDLNPMAVELARLSLWIHTFVPGLPLSFLDVNLVVGNSLVGIATFDEARELIGAETNDLFAITADELLGASRVTVQKLARLADATAAEVKEARKLYNRARQEIRPTEELFSVLAASRVDDQITEAVESRQVTTRLAHGDLFAQQMLRRAQAALEGLRPLHFPTAFPQVFLRQRSGFDVILGNPPWQEATIEQLAFWARHDPGLRGLNRREQGERVTELRRDRRDLFTLYEVEVAEAERLRAVLTSGPYPGMGTGDPDLYKAFCWRFWALVAADGGRIGVVLPRSAFQAKGSTEFRLELFSNAREVRLTMLLNNQQWVFEEVHPQYTIALVTIVRDDRPAAGGASVALDGPYASRAAYLSSARRVAERPTFVGNDIQQWNDTGSLPLLPTAESAGVFLKLRRAPRLDLDDGHTWRARPYAELHATNDVGLMDVQSERRPRGFWPVYKGESFDIWTGDTGSYYGWANPAVVRLALQEKRARGAANQASPFSEFPAEWVEHGQTLPCNSARIVFRDVSRSTDSRTVRAALAPPRVVITNTAPYLLWPRGDERDQAYLLGILCSLPLDWYARRFVETHVNYFVFNPLPIPRPPNESLLRSRVIQLAARLAVQNDERFEDWGRAMTVRPSMLAEDEREELIHELDAAAAHLYGLEERDLTHIFETFHVGWDYQDRLVRTLAHFHRLSGLR
jgi:hypothetical protein